MTNKNTYYNYIYLDPRKPGKYSYTNLNFCLLYEPFYVGKGKNRRYLDHIKEAKKQNNNSYKENKIRKILELDYNMKDFILRLNFTNIEQESLDYEIRLIEEIGRLIINNGTLTNIQTGGEGGSETIACYDENGNRQIVTYEEYNSNPNLISVTAGTVPYKNIITGETGRIDKEEFINNPNLVSFSKNRINLKDKEGNLINVSKDDERYLNGELVNHYLGMKRSDESKKKMSEKSKGKVICIDNYGNKLRIDKKTV